MSKKIVRNDEPVAHWKQIEYIVTLLEQAMVPGASVEHDGRVWDYEAEAMRQCDVVIRQGKPPRETLTIVEVQDRSRRVTLPVFEGWCRKREKVRAQHLICVSQKGYSNSVKTDAQKMGNTVRLLDLKTLEETAWPVRFRDGKLPVTWPEATLDSLTITSIGKTPEKMFQRGDVDFTRNGQPVQLGDILGERFLSVPGSPSINDEFTMDEQIVLDADDVVIMTWSDDSARIDSITQRFKVKVQRSILTMSTSEYRQIGYDNALAWAVIGTGQVNGKEYNLKVIFTSQPDGLLQMGGIQLSGAWEDSSLASISFVVDPPSSSSPHTGHQTTVTVSLR